MPLDPYRSDNLYLPLIAPAQAMKHVTVNEAIRALDALVQTSVITKDVITPPETPEAGDSYIVPVGASGVWQDHSQMIAVWQDGAWAYFSPKPGWRVWCQDGSALFVYDNNVWTAVTGSGALQNLAGLGIGAQSDVSNRLAVSSAGALFSHDGDDHRLKINKAGVNDTASLLYQTNFSGRAEFGLTGDDDFHLKVSPDGTMWHDSMTVDRNTGLCQVEKIAFSASLSTDQVGISASSATKIDFDTASINKGEAFDVTTGRFQPPAGLYKINASIHFSTCEDSIRNAVHILKNGGSAHIHYRTSGRGISQGLSITALVEADGTDYFEIAGQTQLTSKTVRGTLAQTFFQGHAV